MKILNPISKDALQGQLTKNLFITLAISILKSKEASELNTVSL